MNPLEQIMGVDDAAELWGLSAGYIKNLCADGKLQAVKIGKTWILLRDQQNPSKPDHPNNWRKRN